MYSVLGCNNTGQRHIAYCFITYCNILQLLVYSYFYFYMQYLSVESHKQAVQFDSEK